MSQPEVPSVDILRKHCKALCLPTTMQIVGDALDTARRDDWPLETFLHFLLQQELAGRRQRRIERRIKASHLPEGKMLSIFDQKRLPLRVRRVLFTPTYQLVGRLLRAKRDYELERELRRLDRFQVVILDDIGYVQQSREEMEVLFTFLAERYERRSVVITSNLVFSEWGQIFKDPLTTAAAIDRVVHHSVIVEFGSDITSYRAEEATKRNRVEIDTIETPR
jgi:DNA replication protein DnaC